MKDSPHAGKVKVVLQVRPGSPSPSDPSQPPVLQVDPSRRRVTVTDPGRQRRSPLAKAGKDKALPKTYTVDAVFTKESSQEEVCTAVLVDVIRSVVDGADGCVLCLGCSSAGTWSTLVGIDKSTETLGVIPWAISWLYRHMEQKTEKAGAGAGAGAGPIVSVSAMELCEEDGMLRDLLAGVSASGQIRDVPATEVHVYENPVYGIQLQSRSVVSAPDAERAAFLLDAAIASRCRGDKTSGTGCDLTPSSRSHMFFSLHVRQPPLESEGKGSWTSRKLTFIDLGGSGLKGLSKTSDGANGLWHPELTSTLTALLSGHQNLPNRDSKLTMLLQDSLGAVSCCTTVIGQVSDSPSVLLETLSVVQAASRIRRTQKKAKSTSCSPHGRSLSRGRRGGPRSLSLRAFHSTGTVGAAPPQLRLRGEPDERSSSDQSCDTVFHVHGDDAVPLHGGLLPPSQPEFLPIVPSLLLRRGKAEVEDPEFTALLQELLNIPRLQGGGEETQVKKEEEEQVVDAPARSGGLARQTERDRLKCKTFAELQERLGCIDGGAVAAPTPKPSAAVALSRQPLPLMTTSPSNPGLATAVPERANSQLLHGEVGGPVCAGDKAVDGVFPGESFEREDSGLYDCEEGSAASSSEDPQSALPTLRAASRTDPAEARPADPRPRDPTDPGVTPAPGSRPLSLLPAGSQGKSEGADWQQMDLRTSPVGKSSPISPALFSSSTPSLASSVFLGNILPQLPAEELKEMKATITVRVQQPLDSSGQDELVFTMTEEVTISGALEKGRMGGNIIRIRDTQSSAQVQGSTGSRPIRIISNIGEDSTKASRSNVVDPAVQTMTKEGSNQKPQSQFRVEKSVLPSFINPMLLDISMSSSSEDIKGGGMSETISEPEQATPEAPGDDSAPETEDAAVTNDRDYGMKYENPAMMSSLSRINNITCDTPVFEDFAFQNNARINDVTKARCPTDRFLFNRKDSVYLPSSPKGFLGETASNSQGNRSPGCLATAQAALKTTSLPRAWHRGNRQQTRPGDEHRHPGGVTSSTPCSPGVTLERGQEAGRSPARQQNLSWAKESLPPSPSREYSMERGGRGASSPLRKSSDSLLNSSIVSGQYERRGSGGKVKSPIEESSRLFSYKLEQLANRANSLDGTPLEFQPLDRGSSTTSVSSKGSSKGSYEEGSSKGSSKGSYEEGSSTGSSRRSHAGGSKGNYEGGSTSPKSNRSPRRTARTTHANDPGTTSATSGTHHHHHHHHPTHSPRSPRSKLSAVGKLMMASPKVRRLSTPSTKNLSCSPKTLRQSVNRSTSLSPDGKTPVSPDRVGSAASPWSTQSLSRNQTPNPPRPFAKSPIRVINGRVSELLLTGREPVSNPTPGETDKMTAARSAYDERLPSLHPASPSPRPPRPPHHPVLSPYSRVTAPRPPGHLSGHASDVTSVLSGELPPAMGKTVLQCPNRNSMVSSGYESMVRDSSENTAGSSASNRDSVSDKSYSALCAGRGSLGRNVRRRTSTGSHPRRPSHDTSLSLRRSATGPRARWADRGIPEAYEIKVYEIDDVERLQRRAGAGKQGVACFSAKLKFLEHRQQRISEVRAKYNSLKKELEHAKQHLMLEPGTWNQEFDLWQTFEVDSLEHLEALEVVTARLESRVNLCKANVMMVTCFDMSTKKRQKRRRRPAPEPQGFMGI